MKGIISFYGKTGCQGNQRQMERLKEEGFVIQFIDLLNRKLEPSELEKFFDGKPIRECVNVRAPQIVSGEFNPGAYNDADLLHALAETPLLIKRPLLFYRGHFGCGFDSPLVEQLLGEPPPDLSCQGHDSCSKHAHA